VCVVSNLFDCVHILGAAGEIDIEPVAARGRSD
jgi:hypothetical protein